MADYSADKVITQCRTIMDPDLIATERHFLDTTFSERLAALSLAYAVEQYVQAYLALEIVPVHRY